MSIAFRLLNALLAATPALAILNDTFSQRVIAFAAAIILTLVAVGPNGKILAAVQLLKPFWLAILFPIIWMTAQIVPLALSAANPIWLNASIALNAPSLWGHLSVAPADTFRSLLLYLTMLALVFSTIIIVRKRETAETTFFVLGSVTAFMSVEVLIGQLNRFVGMVPSTGAVATSTFVATSALGTLVNGALIIRAIERHLNRRSPENGAAAPWFFRFGLPLCGFAVSLAAVKIRAPSSVMAAMLFGFAAMLFVSAARYLRVRSGPSVALFVVLLGITIALMAPRFQDATLPGIADFSTSASAESVALAKRAMAYVPWFGAGVGTYRSLIPVYQDFGAEPVFGPPSTAVAIAIEWGKPILAILAALAFQLFIYMFRGAIRRGRDSFYASAAAAGLLVVVFEAFCDTSLLGSGVQVVVAVLVGLGLSQSVGRTSGPHDTTHRG